MVYVSISCYYFTFFHVIQKCFDRFIYAKYLQDDDISFLPTLSLNIFLFACKIQNVLTNLTKKLANIFIYFFVLRYLRDFNTKTNTDVIAEW